MILSVYYNTIIIFTMLSSILTGQPVLSVIVVECVENIFPLTILEATLSSTLLSDFVDAFVSTSLTDTVMCVAQVLKRCWSRSSNLHRFSTFATFGKLL